MQMSHLNETKAEQEDVGVGEYWTQGHPDPQAGSQERRNGREGRALMFWGAEIARGMLGTDLC